MFLRYMELCKSLPFLPAFSGCDYTSAFIRKGKLKPFAILKNNTEYQKLFCQLGYSKEIYELIINATEEFVCQIYNKNNFKSVNKLRLASIKT